MTMQSIMSVRKRTLPSPCYIGRPVPNNPSTSQKRFGQPPDRRQYGGLYRRGNCRLSGSHSVRRCARRQPDLAEFIQAQPKYDASRVQSAPAGPGPGLAIKENFQQLYVRGEYAPLDRISFVVRTGAVGPTGFIRGRNHGQRYVGDQGGLSDISAGFKLAVQESERDSLTFSSCRLFRQETQAKLSAPLTMPLRRPSSNTKS